MTDAAFVFWSGVSCGSLFWIAFGALIVLAIDRKLSERVTELEQWQTDLMKKMEAKK